MLVKTPLREDAMREDGTCEDAMREDGTCEDAMRRGMLCKDGLRACGSGGPLWLREMEDAGFLRFRTMFT